MNRLKKDTLRINELPYGVVKACSILRLSLEIAVIDVYLHCERLVSNMYLPCIFILVSTFAVIKSRLLVIQAPAFCYRNGRSLQV